jgi:hypothetical protein
VQKVCIPGTSNTLDAQLLAGSDSYNTFAASQPRQPRQPRQPMEIEPSYHLDNLQLRTSMTPRTNDRSLQVGKHLQPLATQLPRLPLEDQFVLQPYMNDNPTAGQHRQILGEVPEFQPVLSLETAGDQVSRTNPCIHPDTEVSTLEYDHRYTNFDMPVPSDATCQVASIMSNSGNLYGSTPQLWQFASDSSVFPDSGQQPNLSGFDVGPFQDALEYYPTQSQHSADVATSIGSSSRNVQGYWPETFDHTYQIGSLGLSPYQDIGEYAFSQKTSAFLAVSTPSALNIIPLYVRHKLTAFSVSPEYF